MTDPLPALIAAGRAAVRERINELKMSDPGNGSWEYGWNAALNALAAQLEPVAAHPADPPLTADDVRRIAREVFHELTAPSVIAPASPAPARVEAWAQQDQSGMWLLYYAPQTNNPAYLTTFSGVHNAADAERMMMAFRLLREAAWQYAGDSGEVSAALKGVAEFLDPQP